MQYIYLILFFIYFGNIKTQSIITDTKVDSKEVRCLVCQKSIDELNKVVSKIDPEKTVDVGGHRLDADGNYRHKTVPQAKSELHLSELIEEVCDSMDNYVRAVFKSNGTLILFSMFSDSGQLSSNLWDELDIIQDDDLNKSLKYYCEGIMEEFEENIIRLYQEEAPDIKKQFCFTETNICPYNKKSINVEL